MNGLPEVARFALLSDCCSGCSLSWKVWENAGGTLIQLVWKSQHQRPAWNRIILHSGLNLNKDVAERENPRKIRERTLLEYRRVPEGYRLFFFFFIKSTQNLRSNQSLRQWQHPILCQLTLDNQDKEEDNSLNGVKEFHWQGSWLCGWFCYQRSTREIYSWLRT